MLILTRRIGQSVDIIQDNRVICTVVVKEFLPKGEVRLGFQADRDIGIMRDNAKQRREDNGNSETEVDGNVAG